ncbi:MAG: hypothetical protein OEY14_13775, partial [Myxococcales bacterium]|nr:hypothetical protein [Myxococcales bacterium]
RGSTGRSSHFTTEAGSGCGGGALGNDTVYHLHLEQASTVRLLLLSEFDGVLHLRRECGDPSSELACNDDFSAARSMATQHSFLFIERLEPGDYFVIVDAYVETGGGAFALQIMTGALGDLP